MLVLVDVMPMDNNSRTKMNDYFDVKTLVEMNHMKKKIVTKAESKKEVVAAATPEDDPVLFWVTDRKEMDAFAAENTKLLKQIEIDLAKRRRQGLLQ